MSRIGRIHMNGGYFLEQYHPSSKLAVLMSPSGECIVDGMLLSHAESFAAAMNAPSVRLTQAESVIEELVKALKSAKEDIEAWREFCRDEDQGVGFGHSDEALKQATNALTRAREYQGKKEG